jgi:hypothetical protein
MPKKDVRVAKWQEALRQEKQYREALGLGLELIADSPRLHNGVTAAFKYFGLDAKSALDNKLLLGILADVCFQSRRTHTKKWDDYRYVLLARCFEVIAREREGVSDNEAAEHIQRKFKEFTAVTPDALRRRLPEARKRIQRLRREKTAPTPGLGQLANLAAPPL